MSLVPEVEEALNAVGYAWKSPKEKSLVAALKGGFENVSFVDIIRWITDEMRVLGSVEEKISSDTSDISAFQLELSSFLKELQCPIQSFVSGPIANRFQTEDSLLNLLNYLLSELMAMRMMRTMKPKSEDMIIKLAESDGAAALRQIADDLSLGKLPKDVSTDQLFKKINDRLDVVIQEAGPTRVGTPLFTPSRPLTTDQWDLVNKFQKELDTEYELRKQMLITRLDVTVQSFQWSDTAKSQQDDIQSKYSEHRRLLESLLADGRATSVAALLAAREDLTIIEKTSNASVRTHSDVQKHVMGLVPDRGGRTNEYAAPAREMPTWKSRVPNKSQGGGRGGHRGGANSRGGYQPQRQPAEKSGFPAQTSGYQQNVGYLGGRGGGGRGGGRQQKQGGGPNRVQGGWSQQGNNHGGYSNQGQQQQGGYSTQSNYQGGGYGGYSGDNQGGYGSDNRNQCRGGRGGRRGNRQ